MNPVAIRAHHAPVVGIRMQGIAYNHPTQGYGFVVTSPVVSVEKRSSFTLVTTRTGTVYHVVNYV